MILLIFAILTYWAWILIHEFSHLFMAKKFLHVKEWTIIPYPHIDKGTFFFARMIWVHTKKNISQKKRAAISLAPRIPNLFAALLLNLAWFLPKQIQWFWIIFCIGGLIDLAYGSIGKSERSDLKKASKALQINPWILRISGFLVTLSSGLPILISKISELLA